MVLITLFQINKFYWTRPASVRFYHPSGPALLERGIFTTALFVPFISSRVSAEFMWLFMSEWDWSASEVRRVSCYELYLQG